MKLTTYSCKQIKQDLSLLAGRDLTDRSRIEAVRRHVSTCPQCREKYRNLRDGLQALAVNRTAANSAAAQDGGTWVSPERSLWPDLQSRLPSRAAEPSSWVRTANWPPIIAVVAACGVMAVVLVSPLLPTNTSVTVQPAAYAPASNEAPPPTRIRDDQKVPAHSPGILHLNFTD